MGLALAVVVLILTLGIAALQVGAAAMSDAPSRDGPTVWPTLLGGAIIAAVLVFTHFHPLTW